MKCFLFLFFSMIVFVTAWGQRNYTEAMRQGDDAFNKQHYKIAINKYFAAEAFDPAKKDEVKEKVNKAFDAIEALRKKAEDALIEAQKQKEKAEASIREVNNQSAY